MSMRSASPRLHAEHRDVSGFFATVQNKMHWVAHGHTAAEVVHERADATQPLMGLKTARPGHIIRRGDVSVAKNYLDDTELQTLNHIVSLYIGFAELQALDRRPMTMGEVDREAG